MEQSQKDKRNATRRARRARKAAEAGAKAEAKKRYDKLLQSIHYRQRTGDTNAARELAHLKANRDIFIQATTKEIVDTMSNSNQRRQRRRQPPATLAELSAPIPPPAPMHDQLAALGRPATEEELAVLQQSYENDQNRSVLSNAANNAMTISNNALKTAGNVMGNVSNAITNMARRISPRKGKKQAPKAKPKATRSSNKKKVSNG